MANTILSYLTKKCQTAKPVSGESFSSQNSLSEVIFRLFSGKVNSSAEFSSVTSDLIPTRSDLIVTVSDLVGIFPAGNCAQLGLHLKYLPEIAEKVAVRVISHE